MDDPDKEPRFDFLTVIPIAVGVFLATGFLVVGLMRLIEVIFF